MILAEMFLLAFRSLNLKTHLSSDAYEKLCLLSFNNPQFLHLQRNAFLRIPTSFCFAVNCSNIINKTKPIRDASFIVQNRNSDKTVKLYFLACTKLQKF